jgi:plastocyanin
MIFSGMRTLSAAIALTLLVPASGALAGTISGRVALQASGKDRSDASNVVIWIEGIHGAAHENAEPHGEMKSSSKRFTPRVVAVPVHSTVQFPNVDPIYHNVFSVSGANRFDLGLYKSGASKEKTFEEPGLVRVYCNIHPQMVGFVMVVDSDRSAVTGPDGSFRFDGVPPGSYVVHAWHEEGSEVKVPVTVRASGDAPLTVAIDVSGFRPETHKNKYGKDYKPPSNDAEDERY